MVTAGSGRQRRLLAGEGGRRAKDAGMGCRAAVVGGHEHREISLFEFQLP